MIEESAARVILEKVMALSRADQTEVSLGATETALTRFSGNSIHQNVAETNHELTVRVLFGKRIGIATVNSLSEESLRRVVDVASQLARHQKDNPHFVSLPRQAQPAPKVGGYSQETARCGPEQRAALAGTVCRLAESDGLEAFGAFQVAAQETAVANSLGLIAYHADTLADFNTVIMGDSGSGYADCFAANVADIDPEALAREAIDKARRSRNPVALPPGQYEVILEEYAVSDMLDMLAYLGFGALAVQEGRSFMAGKLGQPVLGPNITIWDDGLDQSTIMSPFDAEGVTRQRVDFIVDGVANAVCYDSYTAHQEGKQSTGHGVPPGDTFGPIPGNLFLKPGTATRKEMLASTRRGVWVTRFHYTRPVHPLHVVVTGMTRDGTFLIENGEIVGPVQNLRYTQSYLEALRNVEMIGASTRIERDLYPFNRVPALKIAAWNFHGSSQQG